MQCLNIPLRRHQKTTRRHRWVVWINVCFLLVGLFIVYYLCLFVFTRPALLSVAPNDTSFAVRFLYKKSNAEDINNLLRNIPLVSNRSLTINDIKPYLSGDFAVFVGNDMSRSLGIRTNNPEGLKNLFSSYKITVTQVNKHLVLLSEKLVAVEGLDTNLFFSRNLHIFHKKWIGDVFIKENKTHAPIFSNSERYEIVFPFSNKENMGLKLLPPETVSFLSLPSSTKLDLSVISKLFSPVSFLLNESFESLLGGLASNKGFLLLTTDESGVGFLVSSEKDVLNDAKIDLQTLLKTISALNSPKIIKKQLVDGTFSNELVADPDIVSVEQVSLFGDKVLRTQTSDSGDILGTESETEFKVSNREELMRAYASSDGGAEFISLCKSTSLGLNLEKLSNLYAKNMTAMSDSLLFPVSNTISELGLVNKKYSTRLFLCKK